MIICGDALTELKKLPDESTHCSITSPPYYGLRDYGTGIWLGGDKKCDHTTSRSRGDDIQRGDKQGTSKGSRPNINQACFRCGAKRVDKQLGLEKTPEEYVARLFEVFHEVRRVLKKDGTLWLVIADSYAVGGRGGGGKQDTNGGSLELKGHSKKAPPGFKPKDLIGIPWRVAFALQADGWYLRQDIIWAKPNPMPEPVKDRCTRTHEYIFMLTKSGKYYYDAEAIKEPAIYFDDNRPARAKLGHKSNPTEMINEIKSKSDKQAGHGRCHAGFNDRWDKMTKKQQYPALRNKRDVWMIATGPFKGAHFATFPPDLIKPMILAGCPMGGTVLDPFFGAGTTGMVAKELGRDFIGIELNPVYCQMAEKRIVQAVYQPPLISGLLGGG